VQAYQSTHAVTTADGKKKPMSAAQAVKEILKADGIKGLWRGLGPALILVINPVIQYTSFERMVSLLLNYRAKKSGAPSGAHIGRSALSDWDLFLLGAISKLFATGTTYPYLVVKSRLQAATHKYSSSVKAVVQILKEEGLSGRHTCGYPDTDAQASTPALAPRSSRARSLLPSCSSPSAASTSSSRASSFSSSSAARLLLDGRTEDRLLFFALKYQIISSRCGSVL
jgi:hypothetical protein